MVLRIQKWIPRKKMKLFLQIKKGREIVVNIKRNKLDAHMEPQYQWDTEEEEETEE